MKKIVFLLAFCALVACKNETLSTYSIVPLPNEINLLEQPSFTLSSSTKIIITQDDERLRQNAAFLAEYISQIVDYKPNIVVGAASQDAIVLTLDSTVVGEEGYRLHVEAHAITIAGRTPQGVFYGIQTLRKSLPLERASSIVLPAVNITDCPRFPYRAMHLDVARHFFPVEFVKKYIDILALHNMNTLHWHLTDDQGWRIEIKRFPLLTQVGAWRERTVKGYCGSGEYDTTHYGGFYTQDELREVVRYAQERYINVIPEVDMPGHMLAALATYPALGCSGGPYEVCPDWGVFEDILCAGNEETYRFVEGVLDEVMDIFPSKFIHIGGDEAPRTQWKKCPKCQAKIKELGLKSTSRYSSEDRLQIYFMQRVANYLHAHGREVIGWDEILQDDEVAGAVIMSWQGIDGGVRASQRGHDVIMAPNTYCYFDFYQTANSADEPLAIGGCIPVEKVYSFNPTAGMDSAQAKHILGLQANLWTEYITSEEHALYMVLPRMAALAEVQWTQQNNRNYDNFTQRLSHLLKIYQKTGYNYAKHIFEIKDKITLDTTNKSLSVAFSTIDDAPIYYTLDGTAPTTRSTLYNSLITIDSTVTIKAAAMREKSFDKILERHFEFNRATLASISINGLQPAPKYVGNGPLTLVDGQRGNENFSTGAWIGFCGNEPTVITIDLGAKTAVKTVKIGTMVYLDAWIMGLSHVKLENSHDGKMFFVLHDEPVTPQQDTPRHIEDVEISLRMPAPCRFLRLTLHGSKNLPKDHPAEGQTPFFFLDEIQVF